LVHIKKIIAKVFDYADESNDEMKANARLMASAPDLFEACKLTHDYFSLLCKEYHGERTKFGQTMVTSTNIIEEACNKAGEAIVKAIAKAEANEYK